MTNSPDPRSSSRNPLGFDDFVGVFIALGAIGAILFWSLSRRGEGWQIPSIVSLSPSTTAPSTVNGEPQVTENPAADALILPTIIPTPTPEVLTPVVPPASTLRRQTPVPPAIILLPAPAPQATTPSTPAPAPVVPPASTLRRQTPVPPAIIPLPVPVPVPAPQATTPSTPAPAQRVNFLDIPQDFWAYPFITALAQRGIVNGFPGGYFKPTDPVTRAEFAALLQAAFAQNPGRDNVAVFRDVPPDFWAVPAIDRAIQTGFLRGYPGDIFRPQQEIPKVQVLVALATGLNLAPPSFPGQVVQSLYRDADQIPQYATEKVAAASTAGLVVNYPDAKLLNPNQNATRAEVAAIIHQALAKAGRLQPIESPYIARVQSGQ